MDYKNLSAFVICKNVPVKQAAILASFLEYNEFPEDSFELVFDSINLLTDAFLALEPSQLKEMAFLYNGQKRQANTQEVLQYFTKYLQEEFYDDKFLKYVKYALAKKDKLVKIDSPITIISDSDNDNANADADNSEESFDSSMLDEFTSSISLNLNNEIDNGPKKIKTLQFKTKTGAN